MIDNYLLEQLVTFAQYGTLAATAEHLMVTQPTITRGMQKLEELLDVKLFNRNPNKISLTETGKVAAKEAAKLLQAQEEFIATVQEWEQKQGKVTIATTIPSPQFILRELQSEKLLVLSDIIDKTQRSELLLNERVDLIFSSEKLENDQLASIYMGPEDLYVNVDAMMIQVDETEIDFKTIGTVTFLVVSDIGEWKEVIESQLPDSKFLYQDSLEDFSEIGRYSNLPYFTTSLTKIPPEAHINPRMKRLEISDDIANMDIFLTYRKVDTERLEDTIITIQKQWERWEDDLNN